ncbi:hypothetical protein [Candidatus Ichthyocystis hellenicum]|uniref:hypothetical protein n=1 Tax=Candidatus Ichthyocystis hellenicum TaxID=1561003 RepID=UPI000B87097B|nr:hypothetical protein [Candidatus Ichthyocystis hellenicum]
MSIIIFVVVPCYLLHTADSFTGVDSLFDIDFSLGRASNEHLFFSYAHVVIIGDFFIYQFIVVTLQLLGVCLPLKDCILMLKI